MRKFLMAAAFVFVAGCGEKTEGDVIDSTAAAAVETIDSTVGAAVDSVGAMVDSMGAMVDSVEHIVGDSAH